MDKFTDQTIVHITIKTNENLLKESCHRLPTPGLEARNVRQLLSDIKRYDM